MMWAVASVLALILTGLPLVVLPSASFAMFAVPTAALCAGGIAARSVPLLTAGATLAVIEYTVALWVSDGPVNIWMAAAFGVALFVLLELVDFMSRIRGAAVLGTAVMTSLIRYWLAIAAAGVGLMVGLLAGAAAVRFAVPLPVTGFHVASVHSIPL